MSREGASVGPAPGYRKDYKDLRCAPACREISATKLKESLTYQTVGRNSGREEEASIMVGADSLAIVNISTVQADPSRQLFRALIEQGKYVVPIRPGVPEID